MYPYAAIAAAAIAATPTKNEVFAPPDFVVVVAAVTFVAVVVTLIAVVVVVAFVVTVVAFVVVTFVAGAISAFVVVGVVVDDDSDVVVVGVREPLPSSPDGYNNSADTSDGYSPYYIVFGRHPDLPLFLQEPDPPKTVDDHLSDLYSTFRHVYHTISDKLTLAAKRMKLHADQYRRHQNYHTGDMVKLRTGLLYSRDKHKLDNYWSGPYKLVRVNDNNTVELELPPGSTVHPVFNFDKIEPFRTSDTNKFPLDKFRLTPVEYGNDSYGFDRAHSSTKG